MKRKQALIAGLACLVFILDGLMVTGCWIKTQSIEKRLEQRHRVIEQLGKIESAAQAMGSYAHSYVLNASDSSLESYYTSEVQVLNLVEALRMLISDNKVQQVHFTGLQNVIAQRFEWEHKILSTYNLEGKEQALALIESRGGAPVMDKIRSQLKDIENTEKSLLKTDAADYERYRTGSLIAITLLTIGGGIALWQAIEMFSRSASLEADRMLACERLEQMNKQLNKQVSELLKAQQDANSALTVRSQFLARISHELRTPLAGIIGATELALSASSREEQRALIETAQQSSNILLELVDDILDFEKLERQKLQLEPAVFDLPLAVNSALEPLKMRAKSKGISFTIDVDPDVPRQVFSDRLRIQQVLINLADNATKFTDQGGVSVAVSVEERNATQAMVRFTVSDTGIGIKAELLDQIWEPFNQTAGFSTRRYGGSGLGLAISKKLVEILHGQIEILSSLGQGSKFIFKVPLNLYESACITAEPQTPVVIMKAASILVVDDSETICKVTGAQLEVLKCEVHFASSGQEAVELTKQRRFDLILMDIQMPGMDGVQAAWVIRTAPENLCRDVPIIAFTAHAMPGDEEKYLAAGMSGYLAKPVMLGRMRQLLEKWIHFGSDYEAPTSGLVNRAHVESFRPKAC